MFKLYAFAVVVLFWVTLSASLMGVQLVASPVYKMRLPTHRSTPIHATMVAQGQAVSATISYN
ncbi:MAG TPA: hypothetical protein VF598_09065 [Hymenobacter sp.]